MDPILTDAFEQLVAEQCDFARVRKIETGESPQALWDLIAESGFADALVPESDGGSGLSLNDVSGLILACGHYALPLPLGHTMLARAALAASGVGRPDGSIAIANHARTASDGSITVAAVPFGLTAEWIWLQIEKDSLLVPASDGERTRSGGFASLDADIRWAKLPANSVRFAPRIDARLAGAVITAGLLAGAMQRAGEMSIEYANQRVQFGKPIGKLQAIQQQLSVMCEQMYAARTAALIGLQGGALEIDTARVATAKSRASEAAVAVAAISHAVHGAIGITAEYDLQMLTRRMHEWRRHYGSESYWNGELGKLYLQQQADALDFVREAVSS